MDINTKKGLSTGKIKPEFGNLNHIKFLKDAGERESILQKGISPTFDQQPSYDEHSNYLLAMRITCVCDCHVVVDDYTLLDEEHEVFDDCDFWCNNCHREVSC